MRHTQRITGFTWFCICRLSAEEKGREGKTERERRVVPFTYTSHIIHARHLHSSCVKRKPALRMQRVLLFLFSDLLKFWTSIRPNLRSLLWGPVFSTCLVQKQPAHQDCCVHQSQVHKHLNHGQRSFGVWEDEPGWGGEKFKLYVFVVLCFFVLLPSTFTFSYTTSFIAVAPPKKHTLIYMHTQFVGIFMLYCLTTLNISISISTALIPRSR
jgi:hypothetical protein